jgi:PAS domain-containing protein
MSQKEIEVILTRQLASYLALPIFIVDPMGTLIFYNDMAGQILGLQFEETDAMPADVWATVFTPTDAQGAPLAPQTLPLHMALTERQPIHGDFWIRGRNQACRHIAVTALPLIGQAGRNLGAMAICWEVKTS